MIHCRRVGLLVGRFRPLKEGAGTSRHRSFPLLAWIDSVSVPPDRSAPRLEALPDRLQHAYVLGRSNCGIFSVSPSRKADS